MGNQLNNNLIGSILIILCTLSLKSYATDAEGAIESFLFLCPENDKYNIKLEFKPMRKIDVAEGQFAYEHINTNGALYTEEQKIIPSNKALAVNLVSSLSYGPSHDESYFWHVIAYPKLDGWKYAGHWAFDSPSKNDTDEEKKNKKKLSDFTMVSKKNRAIMHKLSLYKNHQPVYSKVKPSENDNMSNLNAAWEETFGFNLVTDLLAIQNLELIKNNEGAYSFNFYYVPAPDPDGIGLNEVHRWVSSKYINKPGKVFGFILDSSKECIAKTSMILSKQ